MPSPAAPAADAALRALEATLLDAAARAAAFIQHHATRRDALAWEHKGPADFVSDVDRGAEAIVRDVVLAAHPDAAFLGEESYDKRQVLGAGLAFVVDPLDGTTNFLHGFPWYAVSIAATLGARLAAGVVRNAATGETFAATTGGGAWRVHPDGTRERLAVSTLDQPARALVGTGFPFKQVEHLPAFLRQFDAVTRATAGVRRPGSAALDLCDVACGRFDAFWEITLAPWDVAAGILLVREAGGVVTDMDGAEAQVAHTTICAGNPAMHAWLLDVVRRA